MKTRYLVFSTLRVVHRKICFEIETLIQVNDGKISL